MTCGDKKVGRCAYMPLNEATYKEETSGFLFSVMSGRGVPWTRRRRRRRKTRKVRMIGVGDDAKVALVALTGGMHGMILGRSPLRRICREVLCLRIGVEGEKGLLDVDAIRARGASVGSVRIGRSSGCWGQRGGKEEGGL